jgi:hypothetical protein
LPFLFQHANEDAEKMILGNKNDMDEKSCEQRKRRSSYITYTFH